jgi:hypothetical protein
MKEAEKSKEAVSSAPDFVKWAKSLASKMGETMPADKEEDISLTLEWMHDSRAAGKKFSAEQKQKVIDFVETLKSNEGHKADLHLLMETEVSDPALKNALSELLAHANGSKNTLQEALPAPPAMGGVPVDAPPTSTAIAEKPKDNENDAEAPESEEPSAGQSDGDASPPVESTEDGNKDAKAEETVETLHEFREKAKKMGAGELLTELFKMLKNLFAKLGAELGLTNSEEKFTEEEVKKVQVDFSRVDESKTFTSSNKDVEYVASVLNLAAKPDANAFLTSLKNTPNCVFSAEKDISKLKTGDVLFFHDGKDKEKAKTTAIVSNPGPPPMMKLVNEEGKVHESTIAQSSHFNNWLGYVRMPEGQAPSAPAEQQAASPAEQPPVGPQPSADAPAGAEAQPPVGPQPAPAAPAEQPQAAPATAEAQPPVGPQPAPSASAEQQAASPDGQPLSLEPYRPGNERPVFSDTPVLQKRISDIYANHPPTYTTDNMPEKLGRTKAEIEPYLTNLDPVTGKELTFLGKPFNKPPKGGINLMMIPFLKAAEDKIKLANVNYKPAISRYHGYDFRGLKIGGVPSPDIMSSHAFGMAFDIDPSTNWPKNGRGDIPDQVVMALVESGFAWGSVPAKGFHFGNADAMHFQLRFDPRDAQGQAIINSSPTARLYWEKIKPMLSEVDQRIKGPRQS